VKTRSTIPGLKELLLPRRPNSGSAAIAAVRAHALVLPPESAMTERGPSLVEFLRQVSLFEDLGRRDRERLARIVHERDDRGGA
jgi:hypothetical protein